MMVVAQQAGLPDPEEQVKTPWVAVFGLIAVVVAIFVGMGFANSRTASQSPALSVATGLNGEMSSAEGADPAVREGQTLYRQACAACHGMNAEGVPNLGNTLAGSEFISTRTDQELLAFIRAGRMLEDPANQSGLVMPPSGGRPDFSDEQMLKILAYLRAQ
jgi:disulfide bond formation protein DsbB